MGSSLDSGLFRKLLWVIRCLGCPFVGLFYYCNVDNDPVKLCAYWLPAENFVEVDGEKPVKYRPVGHHAKEIDPDQHQREIMGRCVAEASVLDRLSSLASAYYIFIGIFAG